MDCCVLRVANQLRTQVAPPATAVGRSETGGRVFGADEGWGAPEQKATRLAPYQHDSSPQAKQRAGPKPRAARPRRAAVSGPPSAVGQDDGGRQKLAAAIANAAPPSSPPEWQPLEEVRTAFESSARVC